MTTDNYPILAPGLKIGTEMPATASDDFLTFLTQLGVQYVYTWFPQWLCNYDYISYFKEKVESYGITLFNAGGFHIAKDARFQLALSGRDEAIDHFANFLTLLGKIGVHTTTFTWEPDAVWASDWKKPGRGGALARSVDLAILNKQEYTHERQFSLEETWGNYTYFIQKVLPIAEANGVRLALHPNDPPVESIAGIPSLIRNAECYERAFEIGNSAFLGMEFCCGCWLEGGAAFGDLYEGIRHFVKEEKIFIVHFRNVSARLPSFDETFIDEGYGNMFEIMKTFLSTGYNGTLVLDHTPKMVASAGFYAETAFAVGYIKSLLNCAQQVLECEKRVA